MNNDLRQTHKMTNNYPYQILMPDTVQAHIDDEVRLICMNAKEYPVRGRDFKNINILEESEIHDIKRVFFDIQDDGTYGYLIRDKYFWSSTIAYGIPDLRVMFLSFKEHKMKPMVRRAWNWDYPSTNHQWYAVVPEGTKQYHDGEGHHDLRGYEELGIDCLADVLAYSYKFTWNHKGRYFEAVTDPYEITKRIRKPWLAHTIQTEFGEEPGTTADLHKLVSFLIQKAEPNLDAVDKLNLSAFLSNPVSGDTLARLNERKEVLVDIMEAYNSPVLIEKGCDVYADPLFGYIPRLGANKINEL